MTDLDDIDRRMIDVLRGDGRLSAPALAEAVGVGRATAYSRLDRLVDTNVISGFSARVDPAAVGFTVSALVLVNVRQGSWRDSLDCIPNTALYAGKPCCRNRRGSLRKALRCCRARRLVTRPAWNFSGKTPDFSRPLLRTTAAPLIRVTY